MQQSLVSFAIAALATLVVVGLCLAVARIARRGRRVDDHPTCRRCRFDLTGLPATSDRCPECGADLAARRAIVVGTRAPRPRLFFAAVVAALLALGVGGLVTIRHARTVDWAAAKPAWWLLRDARSDDRPTRDAALDELSRRASDGWSPSLDADDAQAYIARVLAVQADASIPWKEVWGDLIAQRIEDGTLPAEQRDAFLKHAIGTPTLTVRANVRAGEPLPSELRFARRGPRETRLVATFRDADGEVWIDGVRADRPGQQGGGGTTLSGLSSDYDALDGARLKPFAPGAHSVERRTLVRIRIGFGEDAKDLAVVPVAATSTFTLHPAGTPLLEWIDDDSQRAAIAAALRPTRIRLPEKENRSAMLVIDTTKAAVPVPVAFRITIRQGDRTWPAGNYATPATPYHSTLGRSFKGLEVGVADVTFTSDEAAAASSVGITRAWRGEVVLKNVPVEDVLKDRPVVAPPNSN